MKDFCPITKAIESRILILDGAMGTMIQGYGLAEEDYRGKIFTSHPESLKGINDILVLTKPGIVAEIHEKYLEAGADIIETNTFNAQRISLADYGLEEYVYEINHKAAQLAKSAAERFSTPDKPRYVAGSIGPTNKTASMSPDPGNPGYRNISFDELAAAYSTQIKGLIEGGADILLIETVFDTLNAKAALFAAEEIFGEKNIRLPVIVSVTVSGNSGRTLSGQTLRAFLISVSHFPLFSVGLNCAFGAKQLKPFVEEISTHASCYITVYPNAGLPGPEGEYNETPQIMAGIIASMAKAGHLNIAGGCCGSTPAHIKEIAASLENIAPRKIPVLNPVTMLSGLDALQITKESNFINISERTNVAGSRAFSKLIREKKYEEATLIAKQQIENGAQILDICLDDSMIDSVKELPVFLRWLMSDPDISRVPVMIDSSNWPVIEEGLKCVQGKSIVNSISLKEGEKLFVERALKIRQYGAAAIIMAFDEEGQATSLQRKKEICSRAYNILIKEGFPAEDIIFDPNVLAIGTGVDEHNSFALDFIESCRWIKANLHGVKISGGISNLSFAFRGNETVRQILHSVFLYHAINAGLDMGIVNAGMLPVFDQLEENARHLAENMILNISGDAVEKFIQEAIKFSISQNNNAENTTVLKTPGERLSFAVVSGDSSALEKNIDKALETLSPFKIIEGPLMKGMIQVGELFGSGKMFLPQVLKSARVMKKAVERLQPLIENLEKRNDSKAIQHKVLLATVKGDVHDIGKNIVGIILYCNNYRVLDLGIMANKENITGYAIQKKVDIIGLSGLITPSLEEMISVAKYMEENGLKIPLLIGGATTSLTHTALKIAPVYSGPVVHIKDATQCAEVISNLLSPQKKETYIKKLQKEYRKIRDNFNINSSHTNKLTDEQALENRFRFNPVKALIKEPAAIGIMPVNNLTVKELVPYINWKYFIRQWRLKSRNNVKYSGELNNETKRLVDEAQALLNSPDAGKTFELKAVIGIFEAYSSGNNIFLRSGKEEETRFTFPRDHALKENNEPNFCLSDFIAPDNLNIKDYAGLFCVSVNAEAEINRHRNNNDDYSAIMVKYIADRLTEALSEFIHLKVRKEYWGYAPNENLGIGEIFAGRFRGIRPAPGYPPCPEHSLNEVIIKTLNAEKHCNILITENFSMIPSSSACGFYFAHPGARYFDAGKNILDETGISPM